jgi:thiamine kinase-like enzyme
LGVINEIDSENDLKDRYKVNFIDYEYCGWNYTTFDIGNHFCEYTQIENIVFIFFFIF